MTARARVAFRVHGPFQHRKRWRLDIFEAGKRSKRSYPTYGEALQAAQAMTAAGSARP